MMAGPTVYTIPLHQPFADALAAGLFARVGGDRMALARALVLVPNNRAARAIGDAFVRRAEGGLLLPRLVSIGDAELGDRIGLALDPADTTEVLPAIDPIARQLILARLIAEARRGPVASGEAMRLAADLARTLDQLIVEDVDPTRLADAVPAELSQHWQASLDLLQLVLRRWPEELARRGLIDAATRQNRLLDAAERRWAAQPPAGLVVAAGFSAAAPALARLLRRVERLPRGMLVLPGLDVRMGDEEWSELAGLGEARPIETHPQHGLAQLLDRIGVARGEVRRWPRGGGATTAPARTIAINQAMAAAGVSDRWATLPARERRLAGVRSLELATPAAEAQAIALAIREALETPGRTVALVTPDRALATRVTAHLARWQVGVDDSAGRPLARMPAGTLLLALADAAAEGFAPVPLLALLKHPLVAQGDARLAWLDGARRLDRALRGPRPAPGLEGIRRALTEVEPRAAPIARAALDWWQMVEPMLTPLAEACGDPCATLVGVVAALREAVDRLAGEGAWSRPDGRAAALLLDALEEHGAEGPPVAGVRDLADLLRLLMEAEAVRPLSAGGHNRVFIWGLIEARLQQVDLAILGGLNEGVWPSLPAPDPWLAPAIRQALGLPGLERRIGVEAQQFSAALGARAVLLTRSRRDARAPTVASRFWLRLQAMTGGLVPVRHLQRWAEAIDDSGRFAPAPRPRPRPPAADRPRHIAVTKLDRLKADPFAFYADTMLRLRALDAVDADPSAAWRGSAVHKAFELWLRYDGGDPARLRARAEAVLAQAAAHPVLRALWTPRLLEAIDRIADEVAADLAEGRRPIAAEAKGEIFVAGIRLEGIADRIDRLADDSLAIVDWKTGKPPSRKAVAEGYSLQLGLLGLIAAQGGFGDDRRGRPSAFEYWSLAAGRDGALGYRESPVGLNKRGDGIDPADFPAHAARVLEGAVAEYLVGAAPFVAKLHPEYAPYGDYDQLMRLDEWYGRAATGEAA